MFANLRSLIDLPSKVNYKRYNLDCALSTLDLVTLAEMVKRNGAILAHSYQKPLTVCAIGRVDFVCHFNANHNS